MYFYFFFKFFQCLQDIKEPMTLFGSNGTGLIIDKEKSELPQLLLYIHLSAATDEGTIHTC